jgi:ketose-bisphosphate aldolase
VPLASTKSIVNCAEAGNYAVPAFNVVDHLSIRAVIAAAQSAQSPVIIQTSVKTVLAIGIPLLYEMVAYEAGGATVPVSLHLDHCPDRSVISDCLASGWHSVLFDASDRSLDLARTETEEVVREAHNYGATVEAEVENIKGVEDGVGGDLEGRRYPAEALADFVASTQCDMFAPALGTAHGLYKSDPQLNPARAAELRRVLGIPLVLHGGTGLHTRDFQAFIEAGCSKINISTSLKRAYLKSAHTCLERCAERDRWEPLEVFEQIGRDVFDDAHRYFAIFGSIGTG